MVGSRVFMYPLGLFDWMNAFLEMLKPVEVNCFRFRLASEYEISVSTSSDAAELYIKNAEVVWS